MPSDTPIIPSDAVKAIQDSVFTSVVEMTPGGFTNRPVYLPPKENVPSPLNISTLTGLVEYIKNGSDSAGATKPWMVHVINPEQVEVISGLFGRSAQRHTYLTATANSTDFEFDHFYDAETFNIKLQSQFVDVQDREKVLRLVGNIKEENVRQANDDGITQSVTARAGIARVEDVPVPNPVTLVPFRTFREVPQPGSDFILRLRQGREGSLPTCALFEADGGHWQLEAIQNIAEYLRAALETVTVIA
jgi:hypothetical protein